MVAINIPIDSRDQYSRCKNGTTHSIIDLPAAGCQGRHSIYDLLAADSEHQALLCRSFDAAYDPGVDPQRLTSIDQALDGRGVSEHFQPVPHIKDLVHLPVVGTRSLLDQPEDHRGRKKVIFYDPERGRQVFHAFRLAAAAAMHQAMKLIE